MSFDGTKHIVESQDGHDSFKGSYDTSKSNESDVTYSMDLSPSFIEEMDVETILRIGLVHAISRSPLYASSSDI
ncbi:hypothetical protein LIER_37964 [Lithospermum erythrorhizon]|uniref:Uncharacterized protein n=1 Tax=Lithospermum erythrorhizon TaxID=34254 RepID=A0AAV3PSR7_LITER